MTRSERRLGIVFLLSLIFLHPSVRGDGAGYYAWVRAPLIQHNFDFQNDWRHGFPGIDWGRPDGVGNVNLLQWTTAGHLSNHYAVGSALLWAPFLIVAHIGVLAADALGAHIAADGFSRPYFFALAAGTAFYGFCALLIAFRWARRYFDERWALLATIGIWLASSFPAYLYWDLSWSHIPSAFAVGLFLFYWDRTRGEVTLRRWGWLGLAGALMTNIYYVNAIFLLLPALEAISLNWSALRGPLAGRANFLRLAAAKTFFVVIFVVGMLPTLITKKIIYGSMFHSGYRQISEWHWSSPKLFAILFSSDHGLLSWTPILILSLAGLVIARKRLGGLVKFLVPAIVIFYYVIASYVFWDGVTSFGNRFFVSLTPIFVLGLAGTLDGFARCWREPRGALVRASLVVALLALWNVGFLYQWSTELINQRGPVLWSEVLYNQFRKVPHDAGRDLFGRLSGGMLR